MCSQQPPDRDDLDRIVPYVTFDCVTRQRLDDYFFGMLPTAMDYSALRDMTGRRVEPKLSGIRAKGRQSDNTPQSSTCVWNSCRL